LTVVCPSLISVPGARAFALDIASPASTKAFMIAREFAHIHPPEDGSLHMIVPPERVREILSSGWGEPHVVALAGLIPMNTVMIYGPRDEAELEVVWKVLQASHEYAIAAAIG
jgi:phospholipase/carboxylesterase